MEDNLGFKSHPGEHTDENRPGAREKKGAADGRSRPQESVTNAHAELRAIREAFARVEAEAKATSAAQNRANAEARARDLAETRGGSRTRCRYRGKKACAG